MAWHTYPFADVWKWLFHGWVQRIRYNVNPTLVMRVTFGIPGWWWRWYSYHDWALNLDHALKPNWEWIRLFQDGSYQVFKDWINEVGADALKKAKADIRGLVGAVSVDYPTFSAWLSAVGSYAGTTGLWWADNLTQGLNTVRYLLPWSIRGGVQTWDDVWEGIRRSVREWAQARYDAAKKSAVDAWNWVISDGGPIRTWYNSVKLWIDNFRADPVGTVTGLLGDAWPWLVAFWLLPGAVIQAFLGPNWEMLKTFARDSVTFYYNLWGSWAEEMGEFWANPIEWICDRLEDEIVKRW